ncbi:hypothetical protein MBLNU230_g4156t1 [Neophaeotheca triangularis]
MSAPTIPPRPTRGSHGQGGPAGANQGVPQIPPRPVRKIDRSPSREAHTRSPLNDLPPTSMSNGKLYGHSNLSASDLPPRPPSVQKLPSVGQEGYEYDSYDQLPSEADNNTHEQQRNVAADLPMHAPTASVPQSTAKSRIAAVTRTDSSQAAAAGIGKPRPATASDSEGSPLVKVSSEENELRRIPSGERHPLRQQTSANRSSSRLSASGRRPSSAQGEEAHGIPEIGMQVPMNPNAGDVQAPSPTPWQSQHAPGIGYWNDGSARAHSRKRSSKHEFGPPGSYGMHSHGQEPESQFERNWALKHPEEALREGHHVYGPPRPETALSSEDLNRLVAEAEDVGMATGTSRNAISTPSQEVGWAASEQYTTRMTSPKPSPLGMGGIKKRPSSGAQPALESPLRKSSFPVEETRHMRDRNSAMDSEDDDEVIHVDQTLKPGSKVTGGGVDDAKEDLGPMAGNTDEHGGWVDERGYGVPILASDEVMKRPESAFLQPAINPDQERRGSGNYEDDSDHAVGFGHRKSSQPNSRSGSRPGSRPSSMHGGFHGGLTRFISREEEHHSGMGTPLEEIEEYEPLFPDDDDDTKAEKLRKNAVRAQRPGLAQHHFPSQDVWEDTPNSLQLQTTVETPEPAREQRSADTEKPATAVFETPEQEQRRRTENPEDMTSDRKTFAKPHFSKGGQGDFHDNRSHVHRFPSRDVWEDTPDSMRIETTVSGPQEEEIDSPQDARPTTTGMAEDDDSARATTGIGASKPQIPARPERKSKLAQEIKPDVPQKEDSREQEVPDLGEKTSSPTKGAAPSIPERPKPSVPARPTRQTSSDGAPLTKQTSSQSNGSGVTSPPVPKTKPAVPARPTGSKISALQSTFMNDLNSRLKLGPQGPPPQAKEAEPEPQEEKAPLVDARKSRAKGPARRKPAASPTPAAAVDATPVAFTFSPSFTLWHIDENEKLNVPVSSSAQANEAQDAADAVEASIAANVETNAALDAEAIPADATVETAAEAAQDPLESVEQPMAPQMRDEAIGAEGDAPPPAVSPETVQSQDKVLGGLQEALRDSEMAEEDVKQEKEKSMVREE